MRYRLVPVVVALSVALLVLILSAPVAAQAPASPPGTYATEWAEYTVYIGPDASSGTRTVGVVALTDPTAGAPSWEFRDRSTGSAFCWGWPDGHAECDGWIGSIAWYDYPSDPDGALQTRWFVLDLESMSAHAPGRRWEVGTKQVTAPATRTVTFNLTAGQTVAGSVPVKMTANGLDAGSYRWYVSVDGTQVAYRVESTTAITWWWNTGGLTAGSHVLSVRVLDAAGHEARGSVTVKK